MAVHGPDTPLNYHDALCSPQADEWHKAMEEEYDLLIERGTWVLEDLPDRHKAIRCHWTFIIKLGPNGEILRFKACLVAQGFSQIIGIDFNDTFAPTIRWDTLWALLHLAVAHGWYHGQDVIMWSSKQQPMVAVSATEGEYMSGSYTTCQGLWLRHLLTEIGLELDNVPTTLFLNNHGAMDLSNEACHHQHTDIHHHFICKHVEDNTFKIIHCPTQLMLTDGLTKPLACNSFSKMVDGLGLLLY